MIEFQSFPFRKPDFSALLDYLPFEEELFFFENEYCHGLLAEIKKIVVVAECRETAFLSPTEWKHLQRITAPNTRRNRIAGRICAKILWHHVGDGDYRDQIDWNNIETLRLDIAGKESVPQLFVNGQIVNRSLTISHSDDLVLVLLAKFSDIRIGCDLVPENAVKESVQRAFFHDSEKDFNRDQVWAIKETAFKAMGQGRPFRPKDWLSEKIDDNNFFCTDLVSEQRCRMMIQTSHFKNHIVAVGQFSAPSR